MSSMYVIVIVGPVPPNSLLTDENSQLLIYLPVPTCLRLEHLFSYWLREYSLLISRS